MKKSIFTKMTAFCCQTMVFSSWAANTVAPPQTLPAQPPAVSQSAAVVTPVTQSKPELLNRVVAIVNQGVITQSELDEAMLQAKMQIQQAGLTVPADLELQRQVLKSLVLQTIALQLAAANGVSVSDGEVTQAVQSLADSNHLTLDQLKQVLNQYGLTYADYYDSIKKQMIITRLEQKAVANSIMVTPQEIDNYLAARQVLNKNNESYDVAHILIALPTNPTPDVIETYQKKAQDLVAQLKSHTLEFSKAAIEYSNASDALQGGDLGYRTLTDLPTLFVKPVTTMQVGDVVGPLQDASGFHILTLKGIKNPPEAPHTVKQYQVSVILIKTSPVISDDRAQTQLEQLRQAVENGASFAKLAETNSQDAYTRAAGGDLGFVSLDQLNNTLATQVESLPVKTVSRPFKDADGWKIIEVMATRDQDDTSNWRRQEAAQALFRQKAENALQTWQDKILGDSYVHIVVPSLRTQNQVDE